VRPPCYLEADDPVRTMIADLQQERYRLHRFLSTFRTGELPECPTCGTPAERVKSQLPEAEIRLGELNLEIGNYQYAWQQSEAYRRDGQAWYEADKAQRNLLEVQLQDQPTCQAPLRAEAALQAVVDDYEQLRADLAALQREHRDLEKVLCGLRSRRTAVE